MSRGLFALLSNPFAAANLATKAGLGLLGVYRQYERAKARPATPMSGGIDTGGGAGPVDVDLNLVDTWSGDAMAREHQQMLEVRRRMLLLDRWLSAQRNGRGLGLSDLMAVRSGGYQGGG